MLLLVLTRSVQLVTPAEAAKCETADHKRYSNPGLHVLCVLPSELPETHARLAVWLDGRAEPESTLHFALPKGVKSLAELTQLLTHMQGDDVAMGPHNSAGEFVRGDEPNALMGYFSPDLGGGSVGFLISGKGKKGACSCCCC